MLLFTDGFECEHPKDISRKWGIGENFDVDDLEIVTGWDDSTSPPGKFSRRPEDSRALRFGGDNAFNPLCTYIRKSRSVFVGVGLRWTNVPYGVQPRFTISFHTRTFPGVPGKIEIGNEYSAGGIDSPVVATCLFIIRGTYADITWSFPSDSCSDIYQQINKNTDLTNGDWHYLQAGMTLHGNTLGDPQAWVETRIGSTTADRNENVLTAAPDSENGHFIDAVTFSIEQYTSYDDVYITNDEGEVNNSFLGPIYIRSILPETQGSINDGVPVNTSEVDRAQAVNEAKIGIAEPMPASPPAPEDDQHFLAWEDPRIKYLQLPRKGSAQTFDFSNPNFAGAEPKFFGAVAYMMVRPGYYDQGQTGIKPIMKSGLTDIEPTMEQRRPLMCLFDNEWEIRRGIFENPDIDTDIVGFLSTHWNRTALANAEFGVEVIASNDDPDSYLPEFLRVQYVHDDLIDEQFDFLDAPERFGEELMAETFGVESDTVYQWTFPVIDNIALSDGESGGVKILKAYINSVLGMSDVIPWTYLFVGDQISFEETLQTTWLQVLEELLTSQDTSYHFWVEEIIDTISTTPSNTFGFNINAFDNLEMVDVVGTNHEFISDEIQVDSTYIFSGHELVAETLYPDDESSNGVLEAIQESINFEEDHYNGWYVANITDQFSIVDDMLTQHWSYEWLFGICLDAWQNEPIEQEGNDGDHTGMLESQYLDWLEELREGDS